MNELTPTIHTRAPFWQDVPAEKWTDWRWQMSHRLNSLDELAQVVNLTDSERQALQTNNLFRVDITPYFASLMDPDDIHCPVRKQIIPTSREIVPFEAMMEDSLAEDKHSPVPGLVHRYPDRVLMLITTQCASYCRYCTRSRIVGDPGETFSRQEFDAQIAYIEQTPQIRDVLLSGGDPLVLAPKQLDMILGRLRAIPHIEIIRIGSRVPVFLPQRVTDEFCEMLAKYHPLWMNIHVNHPKEITPELAAACDRLSRAGVPLGNQSVLLAGVNDSIHIQRQLVHELVKIRVRPYYLYQCDLVKGAGHFRTSVSKGIEIIEGLRGHTSGYAVPTYVVDAPGGGGKIPVMPNYVISQAPGKVVLRNFEGFITTYAEPLDYDPHEVELQRYEVRRRLEPGQEGVLALLEGQRMTIEPEGFGHTHARGGGEHRLRSGDLAAKWQPLGVGAMEGEQAQTPKQVPANTLVEEAEVKTAVP
ncbi:MAG: lysine 2,3-aminomutase [Chloroflexi bacterium]|nr:lysine 2,3-aminomutase [Ardenticatenaceae bacterium]MBL1130351.1 lysine 2,3-aminomutase [Chloroflexota bacterium]NOG36442.1 lysine 2,3-aminomutase [Chloroflexota bacterium]GIK57794.1 MAG: lysine 2,3-aminomutase [Chloroflexota bacterium]